jgi:rhodanese-related sulfurtransferase
MKTFIITFFLVVFATPLLVGAEPAVKNVGVEEFAKMRDSKTNVVLDVRTKAEYDAGHMPGAVLIDFNAEDFEKKVAALDKNKTYLVHCAAGGRSAKACDKMSKMNFSSLVNLQGGFRAWEKAGKPVEK